MIHSFEFTIKHNFWWSDGSISNSPIAFTSFVYASLRHHAIYLVEKTNSVASLSGSTHVNMSHWKSGWPYKSSYTCKTLSGTLRQSVPFVNATLIKSCCIWFAHLASCALPLLWPSNIWDEHHFATCSAQCTFPTFLDIWLSVYLIELVVQSSLTHTGTGPSWASNNQKSTHIFVFV